MKKNLRRLAGAAAGAVVALGFNSCAYDPYYSPVAVGGSYSSGYGDGYGYGGSSFSSSIFVSTGDPQWGYDPDCYSYYDYHRRCYYDPYLNGYYPVGYRPPVVYGVPHPYGWHPGSGYCRPPSRVTNVTISNYRDRESSYRNSSYGWATQVRQQPTSQTRQQDQRSSHMDYTRQNSYTRPDSNVRPSTSPYVRESQGGNSYRQTEFQNSKPYEHKETNTRSTSAYPSGYRTTVTGSQPPSEQGRSAAWSHQQPHSLAQPDYQKGSRQQAQPKAEKYSRHSDHKSEPDESGARINGL